jgi:hypothetical protein
MRKSKGSSIEGQEFRNEFCWYRCDGKRHHLLANNCHLFHIFSLKWRIPICRDVLVQRYGFFSQLLIDQARDQRLQGFS